ncbi:MAG: hypothetical protein HY226_04035 [Candidatus Vogelbacteria bacterium]|nr:hypothetical protein [Candidatus Vogelbacteria bacterium]
MKKSKMTVVYYREKAPVSFKKAIFLAGPTPRTKEETRYSWRPKALRVLEEEGYDGVVFVPEYRDVSDFPYPDFGYKDTIKWEHDSIEMSDAILFWVPRDIKNLPGFTTNIEFGWQLQTGRVVFGAPAKAPKMDYLRYMCDRFKVKSRKTLQATIRETLRHVGEGVLREDGERNVPLHIWNTAAFQAWYKSQKSVGNRLDGAQLTFQVSKKKRVVVWGLATKMFVAAENRHKWNEGVFARPDLSSVVIYKPAKDILDSQVVFVKEYRQAVRNSECYVWDLPGGSAPDFGTDYLETADDEVFEETGFRPGKKRFKSHGSRQVASTLSSHHVHLYSFEITGKELRYFKSQKGKIHGADPENETGERVYIEIKTVREILAGDVVDWGTVGEIMKVLHTSLGR